MYTGLSNLGLSGYHSQYSELKEQAIAAARRNNASLWFAGAPADLAGFVWQDSAGTTPATGTDPIGLLTDRAGSNPATQATAGSRPTLELQANGYFGMRFNGSPNFLQHTLVAGKTSPHTLIAASNTTSVASSRTMATAGAPAVFATQRVNQLRLNPTSGNLASFVVVDAGGSSAINDAVNNAGITIVASSASDGSQITLRKNGVTVGANSIAAGAATVTIGVIGAKDGAGSEPMIGLIWLICQSINVMPDPDRIAIERFGALLSGAPYA